MDIKQKTADLNSLLAELEKRAMAVNKDLAKEHSADSSEQAQERENDEVLEAIATESEHEIVQIKAALRRIDEGSYGECANCGDDINQARLDALPYATKCINCAD